MGFNEGSVGIAFLGTYGSAAPSKAALDAVARLIAWRLDVAHVDPATSLTHISNGNPRFAAGVPVLLKAVSGHRDTYHTSCPGERAYAQLPTLARLAAATGLPKLYEPRVQGRLGGPVRFRARLSGAVPWSTSVIDADGVVVATGSGVGPNLDWTWDATGVTSGRFTWSLGGPSIRPATGVLAGGTAALTISATSTPAVISPDGDGQADSVAVRYRLGRTSNVTMTVLDSLGNPLSSLPLGQRLVGSHTFTLTADSYPDGSYQLQLSAEAGTSRVSTTIPFVVNRTLVRLVTDRPRLSPNGDGRNDSLLLAFGLTLPSEITVEARTRSVAQPVTGPSPFLPGEQALPWDGRLASGARIPDGTYTLAVTATNTSGVVTQGVPLVVDTRAPVLRRISTRPLRVRVGEAATVRLRVNGNRVVRTYKRAGVYRLYVTGRRVTGFAEDLAGNRTPSLRLR
jgi:flagellar hook assembly protein FlgD